MQHLLFEQEGPIGILRFNRPEALNALNSKLMEELSSLLSQHLPIRVMILTGSGEKAFIAGADIREMAPLSVSNSQRFCEVGQQMTLLLERAPFVTIAAINGFALGGGLEIALACDFIYASRTAKMGLPEVSLGVIPGFGGTQRLSRAVGARHAKELIYTGRKITAEEALAIGLVNRVCDPGDLLNVCRTTAHEILKNSHGSIIKTKQVIDHACHLPLEQALAAEQEAFVACFASADRQEGMQAFLEKRAPQFQGVATC